MTRSSSRKKLNEDRKRTTSSLGKEGNDTTLYKKLKEQYLEYQKRAPSEKVLGLLKYLSNLEKALKKVDSGGVDGSSPFPFRAHNHLKGRGL